MLSLAITYQPIARRMSAFAALVCFVSVVLYGAFLLVTVEKAAAQQKYQSDASDIQSSLAMLETQYLAESDAIVPDQVATYGLVPVSSSQIAYETTSANQFSMR